MAVHRATGGGLLNVKSFLGDASPLLRERAIAAARKAGSDSSNDAPATLEDPLMSDPEIGAVIRKIQDEESDRIRRENEGRWPLGSCHRIWKRMKNRLSTEHGIEWFSPADLNPFVAFD